MSAMHFEVSRKDLRATRFHDEPLPDLRPGEVLLAIERFAFTANNVTYAVFGDAMAYWAFFPAGEAWGRIPVWGYARVIGSRAEGLAEGERLHGYLPMSTHLVIEPQKLTAARLVDGAAHRRKLPAPYQSYVRLAGDAAFPHALEDHLALFRPLFSTSFMAEDFLSDQAMFGARRVVLSSASSKTALGLAWVLKQRGACEVVGLTSPGNRAFCEQTGYYDRVLPYDGLGMLDPATPTVFVDMAGNGQLLHDVHHHFRDALRHSCIIGGTHWEQRRTQHGLPGPKPAFFFAPTQLGKRAQDWGPAEMERRITESMARFLASTSAWLQLRHGRGPDAIQAVYLEMLEGRAPPAEGHILSF